MKQKLLIKNFKQECIGQKIKEEKCTKRQQKRLLVTKRQEKRFEINIKKDKFTVKDPQLNKNIKTEVNVEKISVHPLEKKNQVAVSHKKEKICLKKQKVFCAVTKPKSNRWSNFIKTINPDEIIQRIERDLDTPRYKAGLEPKIVHQEVDNFTGFFLFYFYFKVFVILIYFINK